jgi:hypothetical protein
MKMRKQNKLNLKIKMKKTNQMKTTKIQSKHRIKKNKAENLNQTKRRRNKKLNTKLLKDLET